MNHSREEVRLGNIDRRTGLPDAALHSAMANFGFKPSTIILVLLVWLFYAATFFMIEYMNVPAVLGVYNIVSQVFFDFAAMSVAIYAFLTTRNRWRWNFALLTLALLFMGVTDFFWGLTYNVYQNWRTLPYIDLTFRIPFLIALIFWSLFWWRILTSGPVRVTKIIVLVVFLVSAAVVGLFYQHYSNLLSNDKPSYAYGFIFSTASVEMIGLGLCLSGAFFRHFHYPRILSLGYVGFVDTAFVSHVQDLTGEILLGPRIELPWTFSLTLMAFGTYALSKIVHANAREEESVGKVAIDYSIGMYPFFAMSLVVGGLLIGITLSDLWLEAKLALGIAVIGALCVFANFAGLAHGLAFTREVFGQTASGPGSSSGGWASSTLRLLGSDRVAQSIRSLLGGALFVGTEFKFDSRATWLAPDKKTAFLAMPFTKDWSDSVKNAVQEAGNLAEWRVIRADEFFSSHDLHKNIWIAVCKTEVFIADITNGTPNVMYEIGLAQSLGKPVILLCDKEEKPPFDLLVQRTIYYDGSSSDLAELKDELQKILKSFQ